MGGWVRDSPSTRMGHWGLQLRSFSARIGHHEPSTRYSISSASSHSLRILERSLGTEGDTGELILRPAEPHPAPPDSGGMLTKPLSSLQKKFHESTSQAPVI